MPQMSATQPCAMQRGYEQRHRPNKVVVALCLVRTTVLLLHAKRKCCA